MLRYTLVLVIGLWATIPAWAGTWAEALFEDLSKDFGSVPRGTTLSHPFRIRNSTSGPVHIAGVRVSCGCVTATALKNDLAPGEETVVMAYMDTMCFPAGSKTTTIYVQFDRPQWDEVHLWVQANSRDDFSVSPDTLTFGRIKRGASSSVSVTINFTSSSPSRILDVKSDSNYVQTSLQEINRQFGEVVYQLTAKLRPETPVGKWYTDVWVRTNNPALPRVRVPLTVEIEPALSIGPALVNFGEIKVGSETERKVYVRGGQPFHIVGVRGTDEQVSVKEPSQESKAVHVLTVTLKGVTPGEWVASAARCHRSERGKRDRIPGQGADCSIEQGSRLSDASQKRS